MKICSICRESFPLTEFNKNKAKKDGLATMCRECNRKHSREYYKRNPKLHIENVGRRNRRVKGLLQRQIWDYLIEHPCIKCGEQDPIVLEFDHLSDKDDNISNMVQKQKTWELIKIEIAKCQVLCANCHKRKTAKQLGWHKHMPL